MERRKENVEGHIGRNKTVNHWIADGSSATVNFFALEPHGFPSGGSMQKSFFSLMVV
jgi:hypothetical protein